MTEPSYSINILFEYHMIYSNTHKLFIDFTFDHIIILFTYASYEDSFYCLHILTVHFLTFEESVTKFVIANIWKLFMEIVIGTATIYLYYDGANNNNKQ